jgi:hypothetical protein
MPVFIGGGEPLPRRPLNLPGRPGPRPGVADSSPLTDEQWHVVSSGLRSLGPELRNPVDAESMENGAAA